jgi:hypothetical protein
MSCPLVVSIGAEKRERDVLGHPVPDVAHHDIGREAPSVVGIHYDLRTILVVARLARLPALVKDPSCNHEGGKRG